MRLLDCTSEEPPGDWAPVAVDAQPGSRLEVSGRSSDELGLELIPRGQNPLAQYPQIISVGIDLDLQSSLKQSIN